MGTVADFRKYVDRATMLSRNAGMRIGAFCYIFRSAGTSQFLAARTDCQRDNLIIFG
jgi:hypothetical protein